jgi:hypothetical protein
MQFTAPQDSQKAGRAGRFTSLRFSRRSCRLVNIGDSQLAVGACWPSDAGHDYASIDRAGFSVRVLRGGDGSNYRLAEVG